jgi:hypothetical protein
MSELELYGTFLKVLSDNGIPVIWRPLHDMNTSSFWYGISQGEEKASAENQKQLWIYIYNYFSSLGLNDLIWAYSPSCVGEEDVMYSGIDQIARIVSNGNTVAGTVYDMLSKEARTAIDSADVILAKGQGNYETLNGQGRHIFYAFLCKCELFTGRFNVPRLTGILVEENG